MSNITDTIKLLNPWWEDEMVSEELLKSIKGDFLIKYKNLKNTGR